MTDDRALRDAAALLEQSPDFRVLRRFVPRDEFVPAGGAAPAELARAVVVDSETTGSDSRSDALIELAVVAFEFDPATGAVHRIVEVYDGLRDPGRPIPASATAIHGITDEMVAGKELDEARVAAVLAGAQWVIAHNAAFDRPVVERTLPRLFRPLRWACSNVEVPWQEEGFSGSKLEYLAIQHGFFYEGHRSEIDCRVLLEVLRLPLRKSGQIALARLLRTAAEPSLRLWATGSPFETKDLLRERGYRWDAERRCWHVLAFTREEAREEAAWLKAEVYGGKAHEIDVEVIDSTVRFSGRAGVRRKRVL